MTLQLNEKEHLLLSLENSFNDCWVDQENPITVTYLHGFLSAVRSMPNSLPDELWHKLILYGNINFANEADADIFLQLLNIFSEDIHNTLLNDHHFNPIFYSNGQHHVTEEALEEWCMGYVSAANLDPVWRDSEEGQELIMPMVILSGMLEDFEDGQEEGQDMVIDMAIVKEKYLQELPNFIQAIFDYWQSYNTTHTSRALTIEDLEPFLE